MSTPTTKIPEDITSSLNADDLPSNEISSDGDYTDAVNRRDVNDTVHDGDLVVTFPSVWGTIVREAEEAAVRALDGDYGGKITKIINDESNVDKVAGLTDDQYAEEEEEDDGDDDLSVTFSTVWEEIVIPSTKTVVPSTSTTTTNVLGVVPESSSNCLVLPVERNVGLQTSQSSSSFSSTDIPFRGTGSYHSHQHSSLRHNNNNSRSRMMEDSRSLDSMTVMFDQNRHHDPETGISNPGVVPAIVAFGSRTLEVDESDTDEPTPSRVSRLGNFRRVCYWSLRLMFFPIWLLISVFTVSTVIAFCILPGILLVCIMISCYYCCSRDPIPFNVLMQALLLDDVNNNNSENMNAPKRTKDEIRELLICRTCTKAESRSKTNGCDAATATINKELDSHQPDREEIESRMPLCVATENFMLQFSKQILPYKSNGEEVGEEKDRWDDETTNRPRLSLPFGTVENHNATSSVDAVQVLSTDGNEDNLEKHTDEANNRNDIEHGSHGVVEMVAMRSAVSVDPEIIESSPNQVDDDEDDYFESGIGCDICLRRYQKDDVVAWSYNNECIHAYHLHCITDWLQKKITCPNCRCRYIPKHADIQKIERNAPSTQALPERIDDNNSSATVPAVNATLSAASETAQTNRSNNTDSNRTAARNSAMLQRQRRVSTGIAHL